MLWKQHYLRGKSSSFVGGAIVPEGLIVPIYGDNTPPAGWEAWTASDQRHIVGAASTTGAAGDNVISNNIVTWGTSGSHNGTHFACASQRTVVNTKRTDYAGGDHGHNIAESGITKIPEYANTAFIKATEDHLSFPARAAVLCTESLAGLGLSNGLTSGRCLRGMNNDWSQSGQTSAAEYTAWGGDHWHGNDAQADTTPDVKSRATSGGNHRHDITIWYTWILKRKLLSYWSDTVAKFNLESKMIGLWDTGDIPPDWYVCDGSNGTPNLIDYFIELVIGGNEDVTGIGNNTVNLSFSSISSASVGSHNHELPSCVDGNQDSVNHVIYDWVHGHSAPGAQNGRTINVKEYGIRFIQYEP